MIGASKATATVVITADEKMLARALSRAQGKLGKFGADGAKAFGKGIKKVGSFLARAFDPLGKGLSIVGDAVGEVMDYEKGIARLAIAQGKSNDSMAGFRAQLNKVSSDTGVNRNEILAGVQAYQALTGDTAGAAKAAGTFARVSQATGSSVQDVARSAAALSQNLKIDPADFEAAFDVLNVQGKAGAIEMNELARELAPLAAQFKSFGGGTGVKGMAQMGAALQVVRQNFGSASEAATGFAALQTTIVKRGGKLESAGVKVFWKDKQGKKHLRDFATIIDSISKSKLIKDPTKLAKALGSAEALRAFNALNDNKALFNQLQAPTGAKGSIGRDLKQYQDSAAGQMEKSINDLKMAILEAFTPERMKDAAKGITTFSKAIGTVADGVDAFLDGAAAVGRKWLGDFRPGGGPDADVIKKRRFERLAAIRGLDTSGSAEDIRWRLENRENGAGASINSTGSVQEQLARARKRLEQEDAARALVQSVGSGQTTAGFADVRAAAALVKGGSDATTKNVQLADAALKASGTAALGDKNQKLSTRDTYAAAAAAGSDPKTLARALAQAFAEQMKSIGIVIKLDGDDVGTGTANSKKHRRDHR